MDRRTILRTTAAGTAAAAVAVVAGANTLTLAQDASPVASPVASSPVRQYAYVGSDSRTAVAAGADAASTGIEVYSVDGTTGALTLIQSLASDNAFYFAFDSTQSFLYAVNVIGDYEGGTTGSIEAYSIDAETGMLTFLNRQSSGGAVAAQPAVDPSGKFVVVANYNGENFTVLPINADGSLEPVVNTYTNESPVGPDTARQDISHPHAAVYDPAGKFIAGADLGTDEVLIFQLNTDTGELSLVSSINSAPGAGPRHVAFNADATLLYVLNEMGATIDVYPYDAATGALSESIQTISTVPDPFVGTKSTAEIFIHPSGKFLYNSNRGQPDSTTEEGDAIVGFSIDPATGMLTLIGYTTEGIGVPWSFQFDDTGTLLYSANYDGGSITQYAIDQDSGELTSTGWSIDVPTPFVIALSNA